MHKLLDTVTTLICLISSEKVDAIAARIRQTEACKATASLSGVVGTPAANIVIKQLITDWKNTTISSDELASMLLAASYIYTKVTAEQSTELVWTGPTTPFVSARRTEQALLQIISNAKQSLFITSFVAYDVSNIVNALNAATKRGVVVSMLLESSSEYGGSICFDHIAKMQILIPDARIHSWENKSPEFSDGSVHAKVVIADSNICFITSANLTGYAMEKNIEVGVLITNGNIPALLNEHLNYLISTKIITPVRIIS